MEQQQQQAQAQMQMQQPESHPAAELGGDWQMIAPLSDEERAEQARIQAAHDAALAQAQAQQQMQAQQLAQAQSVAEDVQMDLGAGDDSPSRLMASVAEGQSMEERRVADMQAAQAAQQAATMHTAATPASDSVSSSLIVQPSPVSSTPVESASAASLPSPSSAPDAAAPVESAEEAQRRARADSSSKREEEARRKAARQPNLLRTHCTRCSSLLVFPAPTRLLHCAVCGTVNAINLSRTTSDSVPLPKQSLSAQAELWHSAQVGVFLEQLKLGHLKTMFEANHVDGKMLMRLTYYDVRDVLRIQK